MDEGTSNLQRQVFRVAVIGASARPERYSYKAMQMLMEYGFIPVPVGRSEEAILGFPVFSSLRDIPFQVDTVTLYVSADKQGDIIEDILAHKPRRVIFNPGTENETAAQVLRAAGQEVMEACTLVLLRTNQF